MPAAKTESKSRLLLPAVIAAVAFLAFLPALHAGFLNWDDDKNFLTNPFYRGLGWAPLRWMFTTTFSGQYQPLSWVTLGLDYSLWGMDPAGYHLTNLLLHAADACLFYFLSLRLLGCAFEASPARVRRAAAVSALFFALHPLRVESVAWVTERRDVLSGLFYLASALFYVRASPPRGRRDRLLSLLCYAAGLLSKAIALGFPLVLLLLDVYPLRRFERAQGPARRALWLEKLPYLALAAAAAVPLWLGESGAGAIRATESYSLLAGCVRSLYGMFFYLEKTLLPWPILPLYEAPTPDTPFAPRFLLGAGGAVVLTALLWRRRKRWPGPLSAWLAQGLLLAPALGLVKFGPQVVAARYSYIACCGWALAAGGLFHRFEDSKAAPRTAAAVLACLAVLTWHLSGLWRDSFTLWSFELAHAPATALAQNDLADALDARGDPAQAAAHYQAALLVKPDYPEAAYNLANAYYKLKDWDKAEAAYRLALRLQPDFPLAWNNLGNLLQDRRELPRSVDCYQHALALSPEYAEAYVNLGNAYFKEGQAGRAVDSYKKALALKPDLDPARRNLDFVLRALKRKE